MDGNANLIHMTIMELLWVKRPLEEMEMAFMVKKSQKM